MNSVPCEETGAAALYRQLAPDGPEEHTTERAPSPFSHPNSHLDLTAPSTPHASLPTTFTDLPPEVLGPLLLRALPLAPACSPDLIARPCRAALVHLSTQQVAQWLLDSVARGVLSMALGSLAGSTRSDREAIAHHLVQAKGDPAALHYYLHAVARKGGEWLFSLLLSHFTPIEDKDMRRAIEGAAVQAPTPAQRLILLQSLPWTLGLDCYYALGLSTDAGQAAGMGDAHTCAAMLALAPASDRGAEVVHCLTRAARGGHREALPDIVAALEDGAQLDVFYVDRVRSLAEALMQSCGVQECVQLLLRPLVRKLGGSSSALLVRQVLGSDRIGRDTVAARAVAQLLPPGSREVVVQEAAAVADRRSARMLASALRALKL